MKPGADAGKIDVDAKYLEIEGAGFVDVDFTIDLANGVALNGLDAGTEAASKWYYIWAQAKCCRSTIGGVVSESSVTPALQGGCTLKALIGAVYNDANKNLYKWLPTDGREWWYDEDTGQAFWRKWSGTCPGSWTAVDLSGPVPPIATDAYLAGQIATTGANRLVEWYMRPNGSSWGARTTQAFTVFWASAAGEFQCHNRWQKLDGAQKIQHKGSNAAGGALDVMAYKLRL